MEARDEKPEDAEAPSAPSPSPDPVEELARKASRLLRRARPRVQRIVAQARPEVEKASRAALQYWRDHDEEIKQSATKLVRARARGPLGFAFDAVARQSAPKQAAEAGCPKCGATNPTGARFCNQCGSSLTPSEPPPSQASPPTSGT